MNSKENLPIHIGLLDQLRGVAIAMVFIYHVACDVFGRSLENWGVWWKNSAEPTVFFLNLGWAGVAIFFAISGFCIQLSVRNEAQVDWRKFFLRRWFRIYPPYLAAMLIFVFWFPYFGWAAWSSLTDVITHCLLVHNLVKGGFMAINPSFWSIAIEWQLYLLFPLFLIVARRLGWGRALVCAFVIEISIRTTQSIALCLGLTSIYWPLSGLTLAYWFSWAVGAAVVADLQGSWRQTRAWNWIVKYTYLWLALAIACNYFKPLYYFSFTLFALFTASLLCRSLVVTGRYACKSSWLIGRSVGSLGVISYSVYLLHQPIIGSLGAFVRGASFSPASQIYQFWLIFIMAAPLTLLVAYVFYRLIELPNHRLGRAISSRIKITN